MAREGVELRVEHDLAAGDVVAQDQRPGIVEQHFRRHAAERREGALHPREPVLLPLAEKGPDVDAARVAERRDEERHQPQGAVDLDAPLAEVDLQLLARQGLEAHRRPRLGAQLLTQMRHRPLDRAKAEATPFSARSSWRTTSALPPWRRNRSSTHASRPPSPFDREGDGGRRHAPSLSHRRTVVREQPSSAAIRRVPQPSALSRSIADTSSGSFISSLRRPSVRRSVSVFDMVIQSLLQRYRGDQILMSPEGQFGVSPDTGKTPEGKDIDGDYKFTDEFPMAEGFEENAEFFTLTYETPVAVSHNLAFQRIAPLLWMRAGSEGRRIADLPASGWEVADTYGLLVDLDRAAAFCEAVAAEPGLRIAYIVTDDDRRFQAVARACRTMSSRCGSTSPTSPISAFRWAADS